MASHVSSFMRLVWFFLQEAEANYLNKGTESSLREYVRLREEVDQRIQRYFEHYPEQQPNRVHHPESKLGDFMRNLHAARKLQDSYVTGGQTAGAMKIYFESRKVVDLLIDNYFAAHPDEHPKAPKQQIDLFDSTPKQSAA